MPVHQLPVHQLLASARRGDAVTHQALALRPHLGSRSRILATGFDDSVTGEVESLPPVGGATVGDADLVIYHVSIGCAPAVDWLLSRSGPYGLVHHNITPSHHFEGLSWDHARLTARGRSELAALVPGADVIVADSAFNASEIAALGGTVAAVHPPISTTRRLTDITDDPRLLRELHRTDGPHFLHIGQRLPHKRPHDLVLGLHLLREHRGVDAQLTLVGAAPVPAYDAVVRDLLDELVPGHCHLTGMVTDREVATRLRHATALVTTSAHEGFYVPAVEAMAMGVPVLAADTGAVAETTGGAALLLPPDPRPTHLAEALHALATEPALRNELRRRGLERVAELEGTMDPAGLAQLLRASG